MNLDVGATVNTFPLNVGDWQSQGYDENNLPRSLNERIADAHQVLCSAAEVAYKGQQDFYLGQDGGYIIPLHSKIGQVM